MGSKPITELANLELQSVVIRTSSVREFINNNKNDETIKVRENFNAAITLLLPVPFLFLLNT